MKLLMTKLYKYIKRLWTKNKLFDGDNALYKHYVKNSNVYFEYGVGASTKFVLEETNARVIAVDTSKSWINSVMTTSKNHLSRATIIHVDLGELVSWGRPKGYSKAENFSDYTNIIWEQNFDPDLVLIDGRFRVCCFLTCLKKAKPGTWIIFDDYVERSHYHFVEKYLKPTEICGRQALFRTPDRPQFELESLDSDIESFRFVMD